MKKIVKLFKLRKQSDCIKLGLILCIACVCFVCAGIIGILQYIDFSGQKVTYVLQSDSASGLSSLKLSDLSQMDGVIAASLMRQYEISIGGVSDENAVAVTELSADYLAKCYQLDGASTVYYVNAPAYEAIAGSSRETQTFLSFTDDQGVTKQAVFSLCEALPNDEKRIVHVGSSAALNSSTATGVSVLYETADLGEMRESQLSQKGYRISNSEALLKASYEKERMLQSLRSNCICAILAMVGSILSFQLHKAKKCACTT